ncbi:phage head-tail adapter protein [Bordetella genomosp. 9]|uniref:Phage head-tail adapter protein n=1 Tax=Bordetella genomosp. 9 TaxID=1416803 RepID=A0A261RGE1_9BORD|nr:portal protein [Bordetella genomosp. 9]OZI23742.1 phage head-tail adapter protein [Bordetella genomosp. 9]
MAEQTTKVDYRKRWEALNTEFSPWRAMFCDISSVVSPQTGRFLLGDTPATTTTPPRFNRIIDNTALAANGTLGAGLMSGATSPARPWIRLATPDPELMKYQPVKLWCSDVTSRMLNVFRRSNTYQVLHAMYDELGAYGTGAALIMDDFKDVTRLYPMTIGEYRIAKDARGEVVTIYRQLQMTVAALVSEFGYSKCSSSVQSQYDNGTLDAYVGVMHVVEPRSDRDPSKRDARNMAWKSVYFEWAAENGDNYLREGGFKEFPAVVPRWIVKPGDTWGIGPGMMALGDALSLQHEQKRKAQAIDYMTKPPLQAPVTLKGHESDLLPGGVSYVDMANPNAGIRPAFQVQLDPRYLIEDIQDVRQRIRSSFFTDLFLMLSQADNPQMTATEVAERHEEKLTMLGPVLERLHKELLTPLVEVTFQRMITGGLLPPPPPELQGKDLDIEFVSILAQAQRAVSTNATDRFVSNLGAVAQIKPEVLDKFDPDAWVDNYADSLGVDPSLIVGNEQVAIVRQQRAQQQQQMAAAEQAQQMAETANKLGNAPTGANSNALGDILQNFLGYSAPQGA